MLSLESIWRGVNRIFKWNVFCSLSLSPTFHQQQHCTVGRHFRYWPADQNIPFAIPRTARLILGAVVEGPSPFFSPKGVWRQILASQGNSRHHCVRYVGRQFYFSERCLSQICRFKLFDLAIRFESDLPRDLHPHQILGPKKKIHFDSISIQILSFASSLSLPLTPFQFPLWEGVEIPNWQSRRQPEQPKAISGSFPSLFFSRQNEFDLFKFQRFGLDFISAALDRLLSPQFYFARPKCSSRFPWWGF